MSHGAFYRVNAVPDDDTVRMGLFEALGQRRIAVVYDLRGRETLLWLEDERCADDLVRQLYGLEVERSGYRIQTGSGKMCAIPFYRQAEPDASPFGSVFSQDPDSGFVGIVFMPASVKEIDSGKRYIERELSTGDIRETLASGGIFGGRSGRSLHRDLHYESEEQLLMGSVLESIDSAVLRNNLLYRMFILSDPDSKPAREYIKNRFVVLSENLIEGGSMEQAMDDLKRMRSFPYGSERCSAFVSLCGARKLNRTIATPQFYDYNGGIRVGRLMVNGVYESEREVRVGASSLNLGFALTGLPGSGKTRAAMGIIDEVLRQEKMPVFVMSPTSEWNRFSESHGMRLVRAFRPGNRLGLFCAPEGRRERFYQDLAMLLSAASGAGPYRRPMEKCMLNAFRRVYAKDGNPDPVVLYNEIEDAVIRLHGKRTNTGVKYTKHGENIRSGLEGLRILLSDDNYSGSDGSSIQEMAGSGAVFDMSGSSVITRPFLYALVLNQLYAIAERFDNNGDEELRMLICVEESQIIFQDEASPTVMDIKQRMQDFRKKGVGLMLLSHNITDIEEGIRRICQLKLYLKQAPDLAYQAAKDLIFTGIEPERVVGKLKMLDSRMGAFSYVIRDRGERLQQETLFIRTLDYADGAPYREERQAVEEAEPETCAVSVSFGDEEGKEAQYMLGFSYLGEPVGERNIGKEAKAEIRLRPGRTYGVSLSNRKGRILGQTTFRPGPKIGFLFTGGRLIELVEDGGDADSANVV